MAEDSAKPELPGFRRVFRITPGAGRVTAALEDDIHCMAVTLRHDGARITGVEPVMDRWPWTTCPGAGAALIATFTGLPLASAIAPAQKPVNCTHLYDLAVLAAAHAGDVAPVAYAVRVSDPVEGETIAELDRDGAPCLRWRLRSDVLVEPEAIAGSHVLSLSSWIKTLAPAEAEAARVLQWACLIAHGRTMPMERQSDATQMPAKCHSFQPEVAKDAVRFGELIDFSRTERAPLAHFDGEHFLGK
jgi:hypothetical protein